MARLQACGVIMAGGRSTRMGRNKALLPVGGRRLVEHVADLFRDLFEQVLVSTNEPETYAFLGLPAVADRIPGSGPLGGIEAGLKASRFRAAFFAACDMPLLNRDLIAYLVSLAADHDAVVPRVDGQWETLHAVYTRDALPAVTAQLDSGDFKVARFFPRVRVRAVEEAELARFGPPRRLFFNCNTPQEYEEALRLFGAGPEPPEG
ncbi:molybdenum cofactor guanylyltransferase [Caldinitratiruptor microaerophilus]|uniref:Probable molybdenum cofactor guanylyltransferase n=1 Tax=Caldinitratiruptor microaerophilus TaxID=671077 RepID=A0AA35G7A6_9FIRM|nr:molybdenum cofactor guanylyltransferase [Caldinitratiruptor microaerophilus]BDG59901.1 putative molybdenum cofactor guanylyltransferase [Caldinitratiruptor microaerophilus]